MLVSVTLGRILPAVVTVPLPGATVKFAPPTVRFAVVTSKPFVASTFPVNVTCPVEAKFKAPVPLVDRVNPAVAILVAASKVIASLNWAKSRELLATAMVKVDPV